MLSKLIIAVLSSVIIISLLNYMSGDLTLQTFGISIISAAVIAFLIFFMDKKVRQSKKS